MSEQEVQDMERMKALAPYLIGGLLLFLMVVWTMWYIKRLRKMPQPRHPASIWYNLTIKLFSTCVLCFTVGLCGLMVIENVQGGGGAPRAVRGVQRTTTYVRTMFWGVKVAESTRKDSTPGSGAVGLLAVVGLVLLSMYAACVEDWARSFAVPNRKRLLLAIFLGFCGAWYYKNGNRGGAYIRLGIFLIGCIFLVIGIVFEAPLLALGLILTLLPWAREIIKSADGEARGIEG